MLALPWPQRAQALKIVDAREALPWPQRAQALKIVDARTLQIAADERAATKDLIEEAHRRHDPICAKTNAAHKEATTQRAIDIDPLEEAWKIYNRAIIGWEMAEKARVAAEKRQLEAAAVQKQLEEREAIIEHAEATGASPVEVQSLIEAPLPAPVVYERPAPIAQAVGLNKIAENWKGEITDLWALVQFAVQNNRRELISLLQSDKVAVGSFARSTKGVVDIPGLRIWDEGRVASAPRKS